MILFTHAAVGAAAAEITNNPAVAIALGFASHFILDAIPHWDYELRSLRVNPENGSKYDMEIGRDFAIDFLKIALDALLGTAAGLLFYGAWLTPGDYFTVFCGAAGGLLPDVLQFVRMKIPREPLITLQSFHERIHTRHRLKGLYVRGFLLQLALVFAAIAFFYFI
ncbi:MAG: hypothetical protein HZA25_01515 [Candidatus Niyogibacteria bacterium]|nr:hypothetical protein [Candidatus Niyogibacteria bacterium]